MITFSQTFEFNHINCFWNYLKNTSPILKELKIEWFCSDKGFRNLLTKFNKNILKQLLWIAFDSLRNCHGHHLKVWLIFPSSAFCFNYLSWFFRNRIIIDRKLDIFHFTPEKNLWLKKYAQSPHLSRRLEKANRIQIHLSYPKSPWESA